MNNLMEINKIPRNTYKFLNVNSISLKDMEIPEYISSPMILPSVTENFELRNILKDDLTIVNFNDKSNFLPQESLKDFNKEVKDGFYLEIPEDEEIKKVIEINFDFSESSPSLISNNIIILKENSKATVVIKNSSIDNSMNFLLSKTCIILEENAELNLVRVQNLNDISINIEGINSTVLGDAKLNISSIDLGGSKNVVNLYNNLEGERAEGNIQSIYIGDKDKVIDISEYSRFAGASTKGDIDNKGVLLNNAKKTLRFTLDFVKGAKKSQGKEQEYVMLLTPKAKNSSVPILLANEDDIKGEHGASIGRIDEDTLFYLMSRGLSEEESKSLIVKGALASIIDKLPEEDYKNMILEEIDKRMMPDEQY